MAGGRIAAACDHVIPPWLQVQQDYACTTDHLYTWVQVSGWAGAQSLHAGEGGTSVRYKGMVDCFVRTWQEEGYRAFFKVKPDTSSSLHLCPSGLEPL